ncbi:2-succinyl-5-enolpyruvyl-6-hydroxy-3-cyclohexene-1-carboxylic-acid synthase [Maribellus luteus]|uniref:2-succinyl-5-enolpyruvyl-6-hydroxy-3-cyclohexene-1-carboxylate synthase n=1 Tax=Maribellus luteus TaxID=2305463 RepID=A0A399SV42_9BACT|nr:2-succinyl-5-enolpyruvyl-6-hydroxy-3-cyclohexene-1-carboxylic-acid synthase [Maribellus luteus]RIJ46594.1 2-succinyl-5-enolpyruvyl-6-hydroxy-3-cyclohexene-1-carboxylic-acid synthase [Maribellus luteus]
MIHRHQHITDLSALCQKAGIEQIIISPGSRNAPLTNAFFATFGKGCHSIVDERSAAYVGLGMARNRQKPVVIISTSGTAVLNYSPAIAEAYYQRIPLIVVTADRPSKWIDQQDNQTIRQQEVYRNFIVKSLSLPEEYTAETLLQTYRDIAETIELAKAKNGPVHINVPLDEPLYGELPAPSETLFNAFENSEESGQIPAELKEQWEKAESILLIHGQDFPNKKLQQAFSALESDKRVVVVAENISNLSGESIIDQPELMIWHSDKENLPAPNLLIYAGGQVVSKQLKVLIRKWKIKNTWRVGVDLFEMDTFTQQNQFARISTANAYAQLAENIQTGTISSFKQSWLNSYKNAGKEAVKISAGLSFSDPAALQILLSNLPEETILEFGNSSVIRYSQLLPGVKNHIQYANRGVSGIDGCLSSAVGTALTSRQTTLAILGDLSFVYDSNALWNRELTGNLKIVVFNNEGGGLFGLIPGPSSQPAFNDFFVAHHPVQLQKLAEAFHLNYFCADDPDSLNKQLKPFFEVSERPALLEIKTDQEINKEAFFRLIGKNNS